MSEDVALPPSNLPDPAPSVQINQYIQLVNQADKFPYPSTLNGYDSKTRSWVLERVEIEQDARHSFVNKLADHEHEQKTTILTENGKNQRYSQTLGLVMIVIALAPFVVLVFFNKNTEAFVSLIPTIGLLAGTILYKKVAAAPKSQKRSVE